MINITVEEVEHIAFRIAQEKCSFDEPIPAFKTRYPNILESCLSTPFQTYNRKSLYPTFIEKTSILFYLMIKNHPFVNGNKRVAVTTLLYAMYRQNKWIKVDVQTLYNFAKWVAESPANAKEQMVDYINVFLKKYMVPWGKKT